MIKMVCKKNVFICLSKRATAKRVCQAHCARRPVKEDCRTGHRIRRRIMQKIRRESRPLHVVALLSSAKRPLLLEDATRRDPFLDVSLARSARNMDFYGTRDITRQVVSSGMSEGMSERHSGALRRSGWASRGRGRWWCELYEPIAGS